MTFIIVGSEAKTKDEKSRQNSRGRRPPRDAWTAERGNFKSNIAFGTWRYVESHC